MPPKNLLKLSKPQPDLPSGESRIKVVVRKRPLSKKEFASGKKDILEKKDNMTIIVYEPKTKVDLTPYIENHEYIFDHAFDENTSNEELYQECVKPLVGEVFATKAKCTCFAYGQTGSGKTHTMMGEVQKQPSADSFPQLGLFSLAAKDIFAFIEQPEYSHINVIVSFYEIYCGKLFDLLNNRRQLAARDNGHQKVVICGLTEIPINNIADYLNCIAFGLSSRTTGVTAANFDSSRSHAILQISLRSNQPKDNDCGRLTFIDLAGSERAADTVEQDRQTSRDGAEINKSLLALKECIRAIDLQKDHTPFRGSKLTMVLKESFIGNCRTLMIANVSPSDLSCEHTLNTLRYAYRVRELRRNNAASGQGGVGGGQGMNASSLSGLFGTGSGGNGGSGGGNEEEGTGDTDVGLSSDTDTENMGEGGSGGSGGGSGSVLLENNSALSVLINNARISANNALNNMNKRGGRLSRSKEVGGYGGVTASTMESPRGTMNPIQEKRNTKRQGDSTRLGGRVGSLNNSTNAPTKVSSPVPTPVASTAESSSNEELGEILSSMCDNYEGATLYDIAAIHDKLITNILVKEENLILNHRSHIDILVDCMKEELMLLTDVEKSGSSVEHYVAGLKGILSKKSTSLKALSSLVGQFENYLQAEDYVSKIFKEKKEKGPVA